MVIQGRNRCVFAGLSAVMWALPTTAQALTIGSVTVDDAPVAAGVGVIAGVAVSAIVFGHQSRRLLERVEALEAKMDSYEHETARVTGRHAARSGAANYLLKNPETTAASVSDDTKASGTAAYAATSPERVASSKPAPVEHTQSFEKFEASVETPTVAQAPKSVETANREVSFRVARDLKVPGADLSEPVHNPDDDEDDYAHIATEYVKKQTFATKMANRAKGVAQLLGERIGRDAMDGMPVIERADGSVGDVGTSWWDDAQAEAKREIASSFDHTFAGATPAGEDFTTNAVMMGNPAAVAVAMTTGRWDIVTPDTKSPAGSSSVPGVHGVAEKNWRIHTDEFDIVGGRSKIARVVPNIDSELHDAPVEPKPHVKDDWELSLDAMDNQVDDNLMSSRGGQFIDFVGDSTSIDEPDGLEPVTNFLSFRTPAGHPEVQDTASYIDFLVNSELGGTVKHNRSKVGATGPFEVSR